MIRFLLLSALIFSVFTLHGNAQSIEQRKGPAINIPEKMQFPMGSPLVSGVYTIGGDGHFPTIDSAFNKLSSDGITGGVILELLDDFYTPKNEFFLLNGPIYGAGPDNRIIIRPAENKHVIVEGDGYDLFYFNNVSYLTLDGVSLNGQTTLTIHSIFNSSWIPAAIDFENNSDFNIVQNVIIKVDNHRIGWGIDLWVNNPASGESPDSNIIQNNLLKEAGVGILVAGNFNNGNVIRPKGNIIRCNQIGTPEDSLIAWGIQAEYTQGTIIENNILQNIKGDNGNSNLPINVFSSDNCIIRNNIVHNISGLGNAGGRGIVLSGALNGSDNLICNNIIYELECRLKDDWGRIYGIQIGYQKNPKVYYNTVFLSGSGANPGGSAALCVDYVCSNADVRNNILVNVRDETSYCASSFKIENGSTIQSDYNDLHYYNNQNNCIVISYGTRYLTLEDWQISDKDLHSISEMPNFTSPYLHINENILTRINSGAIPLTGINSDIDGHLRNTETPDIGADEFDGIAVSVEEELSLPDNFELEQNFPNPFNPSTTIKFSLSQEQFVILTVYDLLGNEIETLISEPKPAGTYELNWNAADNPSGVYFYKIMAGKFTYIKKMILLR